MLCQILFLLCLFLDSLPALTRFLSFRLFKSVLFSKSLSWSVGRSVHHETRSFLSLLSRSAPIVSLIYSCSHCVYSTHSHSICPEIVSVPTYRPYCAVSVCVDVVFNLMNQTNTVMICLKIYKLISFPIAKLYFSDVALSKLGRLVHSLVYLWI